MKFSDLMDENYGVTTPISPVEQQKVDLEQMRRLVTLQKHLTGHINAIALATEAIGQVRENLGESSVELFEGGMPEWYEEEVAAIRFYFDTIQIRLSEVGERLEREYSA